MCLTRHNFFSLGFESTGVKFYPSFVRTGKETVFYDRREKVRQPRGDQELFYITLFPTMTVRTFCMSYVLWSLPNRGF